MAVKTNKHITDTASQRGGGVILFLLLFIPIITTIGFGGVDTWMLGFVSVVTAVLATIWLIGAVRCEEFRLTTDLIQIPLIGLVLIGLIQLLPFGGGDIANGVLSIEPNAAFSFDPYSTRLFLVRLVLYIIFFAAALTFIDREKRMKFFAVALIVFGPAMAFFAVLQRLANAEAIYGVRPMPQAIPFGPFVNQHHFAALMEMICGLALGLLFGRGLKRDKKLLVAIALLLMTVAIIFTGSRGGLISLVSVILTSAALSVFFGNQNDAAMRTIDPRRVALTFGVATVMLVLAVGTTIYLDEGAGLFRGIGAGIPEGDFSTGRTHFWRVAWQIFLAHPVIGTGLDSFGVAFTGYDTWNGMYRVERAHNDYLQTLADAGILGFACVIAFLVLFFRRAVACVGESSDTLRRNIAIGAFAGCVGIFVHSFFDFPLRTPANGFIFLLLVVLAVSVRKGSDRLTEK